MREMENEPLGIRQTKLDLKKSSGIFDGITNPKGESESARIRRKASRIPVSLKRNKEDGKRKTTQRNSTSSNVGGLVRHDGDRTVNRLDNIIIIKEESRPDNDGQIALGASDKSVKVADSENNGGSDVAVSRSSEPRHLKTVSLIDTMEDIKMPSNDYPHLKDPLNNNNNNVDFIEMLTLDAEQFLSVKCVCDTSSNSPSFCQDCFRNFKESEDDDSAKTTEENSCELAPAQNNELPKDQQKNCCDNDEKDLIEWEPVLNNDEEVNNVVSKCAPLEMLSNCLECTNDEASGEKVNNAVSNCAPGERSLDLLSNCLECTTNKDCNTQDMFNNILRAIQKSCEKIPPDLASNINELVKCLSPKVDNLQGPLVAEVKVNQCGKCNKVLSSDNLGLHNDIQQIGDVSGDSSGTVPGIEQKSCASRESIGSERGRREQAPVCSSETDVVDATAGRPAALKETQNPSNLLLIDIEQPNQQHNVLTWGFENGKLVFSDSEANAKQSTKVVEAPASDQSTLENDKQDYKSDCSTDGTNIISSKTVNRRSGDLKSRLKCLEEKLKEAGIVDSTQTPAINKSHEYNLSVSDNTSTNEESVKVIQYEEFQHQNVAVNKDNHTAEDLIPDGSHEFCQFDVTDFSTFSANQPLGIYDDFVRDSSSDSESCECDEDHFIVIRRIRGDGTAMVNESSDRNKHNPDRDNLKSLLKKPGRGRNSKKSNRVVFNETKNEFFDADYIILIREDCDLDDDEDDGICTCQQHEMVRLTCCEPNCNCQYDSGIEQTPQSPKFAPPMEFVDAVTLSPPEGYKDMELLSRGQQRGPVCRECSAAHEDDVDEEGEGSQSDSEMEGQTRDEEEKEKTDQSQQTTPTTPPSSENSNSQIFVLDPLTANRANPKQKTKELEDPDRNQPTNQNSPISGILKGGRLWKQQNQPNTEANLARIGDNNIVSSDSVTSDEESNNRRSVRFIESEDKGKRDSCDGAPESSPDEEVANHGFDKERIAESQLTNHKYSGISSPETPEVTLTFKLGNHVLISNNSLKPNSAVRQLFPCTKTLPPPQPPPEEENPQQYLVTAESLRAFEEAKRSKLPQIVQTTGDGDDNIKRAIERNTLRRSLIRYEPKSKKQPYKSDNSLVERIKQLTCDVDSSVNTESESQVKPNELSEDVPQDSRSSPPGEESRNSPDVNTLNANKPPDKSFSPSSSSTASSNSSTSLNQNYQQQQARKLSATGEQIISTVDPKRTDAIPDIQNNYRREMKPLPDIGGPHIHDPSEPPRASAIPLDLGHCVVSSKMSSSSNTSESRRQFLSSTLGPLTACVTMGVAHNDDYYYHLSNHHSQPVFPGDRVSVASSGTEYSLEDIDEGLKVDEDDQKRIAPDVLAGTPSASESGDELAMFVQQDAGRIERIKKKYQSPEQPVSKETKSNNEEEDDENDDYGFNKRPSVRGIKPRFSTTTEILQQIQNQLQPPPPPSAKTAWPYYSESGLTDNSKQKQVNTPSSNYHYINVGGEEVKARGYPPQFRPTSLQEESLYQNCANQRCVSRDVYQRVNPNNVYSSVVRMGNDYYQSLPRQRNTGRPQSPPPMDMSKQYHQTMVYIPYNHIEGYQPVQYYHHPGAGDYASRVSSHNQINKRYADPIYQARLQQQHQQHHHDEPHYPPNNAIPPVPPKAINRVSYPNGQPPPHVIAGSRSESPLPGQFSTARSTQTPGHPMSTCGYYPPNPRYRPMVGPAWQGEGNYATKVNRHSFPSVASRYPPADSISLTDSDSQHSGSLPNGYRQSDISMYSTKDSIPNSPTKPRFIERGVPEGAASVSPQDVSGVSQSSSSTMTSPTSPQNPVPTNQKAMFYAMNV